MRSVLSLVLLVAACGSGEDPGPLRVCVEGDDEFLHRFTGLAVNYWQEQGDAVEEAVDGCETFVRLTDESPTEWQNDAVLEVVRVRINGEFDYELVPAKVNIKRSEWEYTPSIFWKAAQPAHGIGRVLGYEYSDDPDNVMYPRAGTRAGESTFGDLIYVRE